MVKNLISYLCIISGLSICLAQPLQAKYAATITLASLSSACFAKLGIDNARLKMAKQNWIKALKASNTARQNRTLKPAEIQKIENRLKQADKEYTELCAELGYNPGGYFSHLFGIEKIIAGTFFGASAVIAFGAETIFS